MKGVGLGWGNVKGWKGVGRVVGLCGLVGSGLGSSRLWGMEEVPGFSVLAPFMCVTKGVVCGLVLAVESEDVAVGFCTGVAVGFGVAVVEGVIGTQLVIDGGGGDDVDGSVAWALSEVDEDDEVSLWSEVQEEFSRSLGGPLDV